MILRAYSKIIYAKTDKLADAATILTNIAASEKKLIINFAVLTTDWQVRLFLT